MVEMKVIDQDRMAERALGQIEGAAFCQSDLLRDILMGAVEDIDEAMKQQRARIKELEESAEGHTGLLEYVLKQKDELLTENARLREQVEGRGLDTPPALRATSPIVWEEGTSPALRATSPQGEGGERIAASGLEAPPRNDGGEEKTDSENGCDYCKKKRILTEGCKNRKYFPEGEGTSLFIDSFGRLVQAKNIGETKACCALVEFKYCPMCGRKL